MAKPKAKVIEFPAECCGVCRFSEPAQDGAYLCWGGLPVLHEGTGFRGLPVDPHWPACHIFRGRCHG